MAWASFAFLSQGVPAALWLPCSRAHRVHRVGLEDLSGARVSLKTERSGQVAPLFFCSGLFPVCLVGFPSPGRGLARWAFTCSSGGRSSRSLFLFLLVGFGLWPLKRAFGHLACTPPGAALVVSVRWGVHVASGLLFLCPVGLALIALLREPR